MSRSTSVRSVVAIAAGLGLAGLLVTIFGGKASSRTPGDGPRVVPIVHRGGEGKEENPPAVELANLVKARPAPEFVENGIAWIIKAQHPDGGWGAGSHAHQNIRDPHAVQVDPATTAFVASSLLRIGHTPVEGEHRAAVRRATEYLCGVVEEYSAPGPKITDLTGTQIQAKLGPLVDTAMTAQYLARALPTVPTSDALHARIDKALDKCLAKLNESQQKDGSWNVGGGWASVLQSSLGCSALEYAQATGKPVDRERLDQARKYNLGNFDAKTGATKTEAAAGVALYAFSSSLRANAAQAKAADEQIAKAKEDGKLAADAPVTEENLRIAGVQPQAARELFAANANVAAQSDFLNGVKSYPATAPVATLAEASGPAIVASPEPVAGPVGRYSSVAGRSYTGETAATTDEALLAGFGNNGGEEFLSYMLAAESMVILGEKDWNNWYDKMGGRLSKVQNPDGSWSGHHCITSPVFCTAAVVQTMTADHDAEMLARLAKQAEAVAKVDQK